MVLIAAPTINYLDKKNELNRDVQLQQSLYYTVRCSTVMLTSLRAALESKTYNYDYS